MSKFKTLVTYVSGRTELLLDKNEKEQKSRRELLSRLDTVVKIETPANERKHNA